MMQELSRELQALPPSATLAVTDKATALRRDGHDIISLGGGDPDFPTPEHIVEAAFRAIRNGATHYPSPMKGIPDLLAAIAAKMARENGIYVDPGTDIVVTPGGKWAIAIALTSLLNPGDEVLYPEPAWVSYRPLINYCGGQPVPVPLPRETNFTITADLLRAKLSPRSKALLVNTPNNPTGRVFTPAEVAAIVEVALEADLYLVVDELYEKIIFDGRLHRSIAAEPGMAGRTLTVNGLSKAYAMTGWRLGWLAGPTPVMRLAAKINGQTVSSAATFTMHAAIAALNGPQEPVAEMCRTYQMRRDFLVPALNAIPGVECPCPEGAFYLFARFPHSEKNSQQLAETLLEKAGIAATPGIAFGQSGEKHLRFSFATATGELERAVERLAKVAPEL